MTNRNSTKKLVPLWLVRNLTLKRYYLHLSFGYLMSTLQIFIIVWCTLQYSKVHLISKSFFFCEKGNFLVNSRLISDRRVNVESDNFFTKIWWKLQCSSVGLSSKSRSFSSKIVFFWVNSRLISDKRVNIESDQQKVRRCCGSTIRQWLTLTPTWMTETYQFQQLLGETRV